MTIDELARAARTTTRNVRAYATRGLLPPALLRGRTGLYGPEHLARLRLIASLQNKGYSLAAIQDVITAWRSGRPVSALLGLEAAVTRPIAGEQRVVSAAELRAMLPDFAKRPELIERAQRLELIAREGSGYRLLNERLLQLGLELRAIGVPPEASLDALAYLREQVDPLARVFVDLFREQVWKRFVEKGSPAGEIGKIASQIEHIKPMAFAALEGVLAQAMDRAIADALPAEIHAVTRQQKARR